MLADFQQYYGLYTGDIGGAVSYGRAASLCAQLPRKARVFAAANPSARWGDSEWLMSQMEVDLRGLIAVVSAIGGSKKKFDLKPIRPDGEKKHAYTKREMEDVAAAFGLDFQA